MKAQPPRSGRLFTEPMDQPTPAGVYLAEIDGASRGNPGPASYGLIVRSPDGHAAFQQGKTLGRSTNNVAEYFGLLAALDFAASRGLRSLRVRSDSLLLVRQMQGRYKVKSADLKPLHERAQKLARGLEYFAIEYVPREQNRGADKLANEALDGNPSDESARAPSAAEKESVARESRESEGVHKNRARGSVRVRAKYADGALHPTKPLELPDGAEVELVIRLLKS